MTGTYKKITRDQFIRHLKQNINVEHVVLLGAGASQSSGVLTANECIEIWKEELYKSANAVELGHEIGGVVEREIVQSWLDSSTIHPKQGSPSEYMHYADAVYLNNEDRRLFFEKLVEGKSPGIGYKILALFASKGTFKILMTTNFDGLVTKALQSEGVNVKEITIETESLIHKPIPKNSVYSVALHGDFKYDKLKNTSTELDSQSDDFKHALKMHLYNKHLIVSGYSGRDNSLMSAIEDAYMSKGGGAIYWCTYNDDITAEVDELLKKISLLNREAYLVVSGDFDESYKAMGHYCFYDDNEFSTKLNSIVSFLGFQNGLVSIDQVEPAVIEQVDTEVNENSKSKINLDIYSKIELDALKIANIFGQWNENESDLSIVKVFQTDYSDWYEVLRELLQADVPAITLLNGKTWVVNSREYLWDSFKDKVFDNHLDKIKSACVDVLSEIDPKFDLPVDQHFTAGINSKKLKHSNNLRKGLAETLAWIGVNGDLLSNCSPEKRKVTALLAVRIIFTDASWQLWGSLNELHPILAEAAPSEFLSIVEAALQLSDCPFDHLFALENAGIMGQNYLTGLFWALEALAWDERYLSRVSVVLAELAEHDPGGNYTNRPSSSISTILLPWYPQTLASVEMRISAFKAVKNDSPDIAWKVLLGLLPNSHQTSMGAHKPKWRKPILEDWKPTVTDEEYTQQVIQYSEFAVEMAQADSEKLLNLVENLDNLARPSFEAILQHISSDEVIGLHEDKRYQIWSKLVEFATKHKRFPDAKWVLPQEAIALIDSTAEVIKPENLIRKHKRLFDTRDHDLYEGKERWQEQQAKIDNLREHAIKEIYNEGGIESILEIAGSVESSARVGATVGLITDFELSDFILPNFIDSDQQHQVQFASSYVWSRFRGMGWHWVDGLNRADWSASQKSKFLTFLPFTTETWSRVNDWLGNAVNSYWENVRPNPYENDEDLNFAIEKLIEVGRPLAAIDCLHAQVNNKLPLDSNLAIKALSDATITNEPINSRDSYDIVELIKALQESSDVDINDIYNIEWYYLPLLDRHSGAEPKFLERRLATQPSYFCYLIRILYRSDKPGIDETANEESGQEINTERNAQATNAWRLLHDWEYPPGMNDYNEFSADDFQSWLKNVINECIDSGHLEVAMIEVGGVLFHCPPDESGLWINRSVAEELNGRDAEELRRGFSTAIFNSRGAHFVDPTGKPERDLAEQWRGRAHAVEALGLARFAEALKAVAESYDRDAERVIRESARE